MANVQDRSTTGRANLYFSWYDILVFLLSLFLGWVPVFWLTFKQKQNTKQRHQLSSKCALCLSITNSSHNILLLFKCLTIMSSQPFSPLKRTYSPRNQGYFYIKTIENHWFPLRPAIFSPDFPTGLTYRGDGPRCLGFRIRCWVRWPSGMGDVTSQWRGPQGVGGSDVSGRFPLQCYSLAAWESELLRRYYLQKVKLGEGSFGTVWRAVDRRAVPFGGFFLVGMAESGNVEAIHP